MRCRSRAPGGATACRECLGLDLVDVEQLDQALAGDVDGLRRSDQRDHLVERVERLDQTAQDVGPFIGLAQPIPGAPDDHVELMVDVVADQLVQAQRARHAVDDGQHVGAETGLQLGVLVEVVQHHLGDGIALELHHDSQPDAVAGLVLDVGDAGQLAVADLLGDRGDEVVVVDLIRQLGDDDAGAAAAVFFDLHDTAHADRPAPGLVGVLDALRTDDQTAGREVGTLDPFGHRGQRGFLVGVMVLQAPVHRVGELAQVVRRDVGRHTDRDATRTVGEQVREPARQNRRLLHPAVVVRDEIDCLLVDFAQHLHRQRSQPRLGVVADESVRNEGVVGGIDSEAIDGLHTSVGHRSDARVGEPAIGQLSHNGVGVRILAVRVAEPPRETTVYDGISLILIRNRSLGAHHRDIAGTDLLDQLPQQRRHAADVH